MVFKEFVENIAALPECLVIGMRTSVDCKAMHTYAVRPRKDQRGVDPVFKSLLFGRLWYGELSAASNAVDQRFYSRSHRAVIGVFDDAGNVIETYGHAGDFKER